MTNTQQTTKATPYLKTAKRITYFGAKPVTSNLSAAKPCKHGYWLTDGKCRREICD